MSDMSFEYGDATPPPAAEAAQRADFKNLSAAAFVQDGHDTRGPDPGDVPVSGAYYDDQDPYGSTRYVVERDPDGRFFQTHFARETPPDTAPTDGEPRTFRLLSDDVEIDRASGGELPGLFGVRGAAEVDGVGGEELAVDAPPEPAVPVPPSVEPTAESQPVVPPSVDAVRPANEEPDDTDGWLFVDADEESPGPADQAPVGAPDITIDEAVDPVLPERFEATPVDDPPADRQADQAVMAEVGDQGDGLEFGELEQEAMYLLDMQREHAARLEETGIADKARQFVPEGHLTEHSRVAVMCTAEANSTGLTRELGIRFTTPIASPDGETTLLHDDVPVVRYSSADTLYYAAGFDPADAEIVAFMCVDLTRGAELGLLPHLAFDLTHISDPATDDQWPRALW